MNDKLSKFLSYILRHNPKEIGITLDENGYANVNELIKQINKTHYSVNLRELEAIVNSDKKKRYSFNHDKSKIRANQGHSINVNLELQAVNPPDKLYHGTTYKFENSINKLGLQKKSRHHVHLSDDLGVAKEVGGRRGEPLVYIVDTQTMIDDGFIFYKSENGVWLTEEIPFKYLSKLESYWRGK